MPNVHWVWPAPDYSLTRRARDGFEAPRWVHHLLRGAMGIPGALLGVLLARALEHSPAWYAIAGAPLLSVVLHVRGTLRRHYPANPRDWLADGMLGEAGAAVVLIVITGSGGWWLALAAVTLYAILYPWASP